MALPNPNSTTVFRPVPCVVGRSYHVYLDLARYSVVDAQQKGICKGLITKIPHSHSGCGIVTTFLLTSLVVLFFDETKLEK